MRRAPVGVDRAHGIAFGLLLLVTLAWPVASSALAGRLLSPLSPWVVAPVVLALGVAGGRLLARRAGDARLHGALLLLGLVLVAGVLLVREPGTWPLGYANANAALAVQLVALCALALLARRPGTRRLLAAAATLAVAATLLNRSAAAILLVVPVVLAAALSLRLRPRGRWWPVLLGALASGTAGAVFLHAVTRPALPEWADRTFDGVRQQLWRDAVALWRTRPVTGAGPGSFTEATPLAADPDTASAHSSVLQVAAETGWVGLGLFALVALAGYLWLLRGRGPEALVASAAWSALLVHSYVDHLVEFAPVVGAAGVVLGWAGAGRCPGDDGDGDGSEELDVAEGERPVAR